MQQHAGPESPSADVAPHESPAPAPAAQVSPTVAQANQILDGGADPAKLAALLHDHPAEMSAIVAAIQAHPHGGNAMVNQVLATHTAGPTSHPVLHLGAHGDGVVQLQQALNAHGASLTPDGAFGPATLAAVKLFQGQHGLGADGVVGPKTWGALDGAPAAPAAPAALADKGGGEHHAAAPQHGQGEFASAYGQARSHLGVGYEDYKAGLGTVKAASEQTTIGFAPPHKITSPMTMAELVEIFPDLGVDMKNDPENITPKVQQFVDEMNTAFRIMRFDTIEAQAAMLGNAYVESDQFRRMTETQGASQRYESDPDKVRMNEGWLNQAAAGQIAGVGGYQQGGAINPNGDWHDSFVGRGATQVTFRWYYVQTIAVMEKRAEDLEAQGDPASLEDAARIRRSVAAIKADPDQAANPEHSFLFTAAFWLMPDDAGRTGALKANAGNIFGHMGSVQPERKKKTDAYNRAMDVLRRKLAEEQQAAVATA